MINSNKYATSKNKMTRKFVIVLTIVALATQVFGIPGIKFSGHDLTPYEKAMAALPGWVFADGSDYVPFFNITNVSNNSGESWDPSLQLDSSGNPCIAWSDNTPGNWEIFFARWNGSSWVNASGATLTETNANVSNNSGYSYHPSLQLDSAGNPRIAWEDLTPGNREIFFARWNGSSWVNAQGAALASSNGNVSNNSGYSLSPSLQLDPSGNPCIAWEDLTPGNREIFFARWNGSSWVNASGATLTSTNGNVSNNSGDSWDPSLQLDPSGNPCIAWHDYTSANGEIFFARWNGSSWVNASGATLTSTNGNVSNNSGDSLYPSLQLDPSGNPCIAWHDYTSANGEIFFARWNGSSWVNASGATLTSTNGNVSNNSGYSYHPSLQLDPSGNPCIAWSDNTPGNDEIFFTRWNGSSWVDAQGADLTSTNGNVSNNSGSSSWPSLVLDKSGNIFIAWDDNVSSIYQIYLAKWNANIQSIANQWVGANDSVYDPAISSQPKDINVTRYNNTNTSSYSLVLDSNQQPNICWSSDRTGYLDVYFLRWNGTDWVGANGSVFNPLLTNQPYDINITRGNVANNGFGGASLCLDKQNRPHIFFCSNGPSGAQETMYVKWNGSNWVGANGSSFIPNTGFPADINISRSSGHSNTGSMMLDKNERPCVIWHEYGGWGGTGDDVFVRWDGNNWVGANGLTYNPSSGANGNITRNSGWSANMDMHLDSNDRPHIVWFDDSYGSSICYVYWNGIDWVGANGNPYVPSSGSNAYICPSTPGGVGFPSGNDSSLELDLNDNPHIAFDNNVSGTRQITYIKWDGVKWVNISGSTFNYSTNNAYVARFNLVLARDFRLDSKGNPHFIFRKYSQPALYYIYYDGSSWLGPDGQVFNQLTGENGNLSKTTINPGAFSAMTMVIDNSDSPHVLFDSNAFSVGGYTQVIYLKRKNNISAIGIKEFKKEVDTNADGIFDDDNKPVKSGQVISYKIKLGFDKGMKSVAWIVDKIPYEATYVRGCQPNNQVYYSFPAKNWTFKDNVSGEPDENASKGTFIIWKADPANGENQTFIFKVKALTQSIMPMSATTSGYTNATNVMKTYSGVKSEPAGLIIPDLSCTKFSNSIFNPSGSSSEQLDILDPVDGEKWPISTSVRVQWNYKNNDSTSNKDKKIRFEIVIQDKLNIKQEFNIFENNMVGTIPLNLSNWENIIVQGGEEKVNLNVYVNDKLTKTVNIMLVRHGALNYASWADTNKNAIGRHPLIFVHGVNLMVPGKDAEEQCFEDMIKAFGIENEYIYKSFKPYVYQYDSSDLLDGFCDYEKASPYLDPPSEPRILKGIEAVGFELKREIESAYSSDLTTFSNGMYFVCHSMGGLVARSFMAEKWRGKNRNFGQDVTRVVTLGTPHHGSPVASLSIGSKNILPSQFTTDLSWDDYDVALVDEKSPNQFLKKLNCLPTYIGKIFGIQQLNPPTDCKLDYASKIVALAGQIAVKGSDGKPWIDDTDELILGAGHVLNSYINDLNNIPLSGRDFLLRLVVKIGVNIGYGLKAKGELDKLNNLFDYEVDFENNQKNNIQIKDLKPFTKKYPENDGIVPVESAFYANSLNELYGKELFKSQWSPYPVLYNHFRLCSEPNVIAYVAHSICSPILKVSPSKIRPGDFFTIEGKSFGPQQWTSALNLYRTPKSSSSQTKLLAKYQTAGEIPLKIISWSNEKIVCQMPSDISLSSANVLNSIDGLNDYQVCLRTGTNGIISPVTPINEENPETGTPTWDGKIDIKTREDRVALSIWPSKSQLIGDENVEFSIKVKNTGNTSLSNVQIINNIPRELMFVSSTLKGVMGKNRLQVLIGNLQPNESVIFKVKCRLKTGISIPDESGLWIVYSANLTSTNNINTAASVVILYATSKPPSNLLLSINWKGINTKTNESRVDLDISVIIDVDGGSQPYDLKIDWGDGNIMKKIGYKKSDPKPEFNHSYPRTGDYHITIICIDAYGKTTSVERVIHIR